MAGRDVVLACRMERSERHCSDHDPARDHVDRDSCQFGNVRVTYTVAESVKATGTQFGFSDNQRQPSLISRGVEEHPGEFIPLSDKSYRDQESYYTDNGFSSRHDIHGNTSP